MNDIINTSPNPSLQLMDNPFIVVPESKEINRISLKEGKCQTFCPLVFFTLLMADPSVALGLNKLPYLIPIVAIIPTLILLLSCKSRIILIKDKENNRLTVQGKNYFCCTTKTYNIPFEHYDIKVVESGSDSGPGFEHILSIIIILNADPMLQI